MVICAGGEVVLNARFQRPDVESRRRKESRRVGLPTDGANLIAYDRELARASLVILDELHSSA